MNRNGLLAGPGGWTLAPEGAAIQQAEHTAVIADVHLGYEWARAAGGDSIPAHSLAETLDRLDTLFRRIRVDRLVVAGDLVESRRPCLRTARDLETLRRWLTERGVALLPLAGNHDPPRRPAWPATLEVGGWTIHHGDRAIRGSRTISGHHHPMIRGRGVSAPCFLVGESAIILPAFSPNAAGLAVGRLARRLLADSRGVPHRCVASAGGELVDLGPVPWLVRTMQGAG
jgi:putative SbcD/Mre11-related phosphoesterase